MSTRYAHGQVTACSPECCTCPVGVGSHLMTCPAGAGNVGTTCTRDHNGSTRAHRPTMAEVLAAVPLTEGQRCAVLGHNIRRETPTSSFCHSCKSVRSDVL